MTSSLPGWALGMSAALARPAVDVEITGVAVFLAAGGPAVPAGVVAVQAATAGRTRSIKALSHRVKEIPRKSDGPYGSASRDRNWGSPASPAHAGREARAPGPPTGGMPARCGEATRVEPGTERAGRPALPAGVRGRRPRGIPWQP